MRILFTIVFLLPISVFSQSSSFDFHSPENIKKYADYLFCEGDYLRAVEEYESIHDIIKNDTIDFKIMICYSEIGLYQKSNYNFNLSYNSKLYVKAENLYLKNRFREAPFGFYIISELGAYPFRDSNSENINYFEKLTSISYLFTDVRKVTKEKILNPFDKIEKEKISSFYDWKINPPYKSPALAGVLSAIIPGSGKMYVGEWGDGITAFLVSGLLAFLAYDNFKADHTTRAWIFTGLGAFFYAGNIYGSIASAQIFNARIDFEFNDGLKLFLEKKNYFLPEYDFCK
jgi:TM2 domain-containing membrane protein YozV